MDTNKKSQCDLITEFIGEITLLTAEIEHRMNDVICDYFITSGKKKILFNRWLLYREGYKFNDKIECLNFISDSIKDNERKGMLGMTIMYANRFNVIKNKLAYGEICFGEEQEDVANKTVSDMHRYEHIEITPEYINIARDVAISAIRGLENAMKLIIGTNEEEGK